MKRTIILVVLLLSLVSCGKAGGSVTNEVPQTATRENGGLLPETQASITPVSYTNTIPASGEYADTSFTNVSFILDYQTVNTNILATLTEAWHDCSWETRRNGTRSNSTQEAVTMTVDSQGSITVKTLVWYKDNYQPIHGYLTLIGTYTNNAFVLVTTSFVNPNRPGPITLTFQPYPNNDALSQFTQNYNTQPC